jgi:hypothetical protein
MNKWDGALNANTILWIYPAKVYSMLTSGILIIKLVAVEIRTFNILVNVPDPGSEVDRKLVCSL